VNLEECDRCCDQYEERLQKGHRQSAEEFLRESGLPSDAQLLAELHKLEREYGIKPASSTRITDGVAIPSAVSSDQPAPRRLATGTSWLMGALLLALLGMGLLLFQMRSAKRQVTQELRQKEAEIEHLSRQGEDWKSQSDQQIPFEEALADLGRRLAEPTGNGPEARAAVWKEMLVFWDRRIAADNEQYGRPGTPPGYAGSPWDRLGADHPSEGRGDFYRLQRALCLARLGEHDAAFQEAQELERPSSQLARQRSEMVRLYALCAAKVQTEPGSAGLYLDAAIAHLRNAARDADTPPLDADDPELAALRSEPEFTRLLADWRTNYEKNRRPETN
jgi:hypothetical protein